MEEGVNVVGRSRSTSPSGENKPKRFLNGWSKEQERLMSEWSDIAICYRWIHDKSEKIFHSKALWINLPVIILTTLGGTANFGIQSMFSSDQAKQYASFAIGGISLFAGLLTTIGNYLRYAQLEESHRVASIAWGKFQRLIAVELGLNPNDRMDSLDFLKICRADLDRLIEQSPPIPESAISMFEERFGKIKELKKPDICGALEHTYVFESSETRLKQVAVDAALMLKHKRNMLTELVSPQIKNNIKEEVESRLNEVLEDRKKQLEEEIELNKRKVEQEKEEINRLLEERQKKLQEELEMDKKKLLKETNTQSNGSNFEKRMSLKGHFMAKNPLFRTYHSPPTSAKSPDPPMSPIEESVVINIEPINQIVTPRSPRSPRDEQKLDSSPTIIRIE
jgi:hypothetical protein